MASELSLLRMWLIRKDATLISTWLIRTELAWSGSLTTTPLMVFPCSRLTARNWCSRRIVTMLKRERRIFLLRIGLSEETFHHSRLFNRFHIGFREVVMITNSN